MKSLNKLIILLCFSTSTFAQPGSKSAVIENGVSLSLAKSRAALLSNIQYNINLVIPAAKSQDIIGVEQIEFDLKSVPEILQLDFKSNAEDIKSLFINGAEVGKNWKHEHLVIEGKQLIKGRNKIDIKFIAGSTSLNRNDDYLYALFVPDHARTMFPCFDQPDLKARFKLDLTVPSGWSALANGKLQDSINNGMTSTYRFSNSDKLPTYLFSFTAGKFKKVSQVRSNKPMTFLHRETDFKKIQYSVDSIFTAHLDALTFLEKWTGIPYPFQSVGFNAIPDFQFGGMEHPGTVDYKASSLFLDEGSTKDQFISRSNLISHETAHMWFGDLVTMKWFNDVWMKEVFANFMADKVTEKLMGKSTFDLKFLQDHYPAAYGVDRTLGANPIRQQLDNLQDAGSLYGNIIYHKAPIMMRQLESMMGADKFQQGIREYLTTFAFRNATWDDLIGILSRKTSRDLYAWNKVWVNQPGRPVFSYKMDIRDNKISHFSITQVAESGSQRTWPQSFTLKLFYPGSTRTIVVNMTNQTLEIDSMLGLDKPQYILFNADGTGYGLFPEDPLLFKDAFARNSALERASIYINAYENTLSGNTNKPEDLLELFKKCLILETNEMNLKVITGYINNLYWTYLLPEDRAKQSVGLETILWNAMEAQSAANNKKILFSAYQSVYLSANAAKNIYNIWQLQSPPKGIKLTEEDYISLALSIALKTDTATNILTQQIGRMNNQDRKDRLTFLIPALSADPGERERFFYSLKERKNRQKESWVTTGLGYLHHPLRQSTSIKFLSESLDILEEIQATGDIFFPQSWLASIFGSYQSPEAYQVVAGFLAQHPNYNPKLKDKILQSTDNLRRASKLLK
ncbi:M1 family metallopeptidase [Pedobacter duraquae]|uniref:Aminopeptidase N n=1 Tax=Pedobacter duraquae TaxID=425511 RepID=A0A4R6IER9_9SPHI|nr:M1 family aminopeptidase [Pedobacter duraquae]TDO20201.1 aminopeptidase N [Pedobacter duraquae]